MSDRYASDFLDCYSAASVALCAGKDPTEAAAKALRPSGIPLCFMEAIVAQWAVRAAILDRRQSVPACAAE